ncbi:hypothetical protein DSO57_1039420 [Entomophthora muscae]|uniref:Uncharacterized protein n=1 Tax=Entomophthora muscae TaxID=34485 RepID=A0ACC2S0Q6_9FUNG|nr:hypothetical protein DSO57_1039420 [Entomophthora muscae]
MSDSFNTQPNTGKLGSRCILNPTAVPANAPAKDYYSRENNSPTLSRNRTLSMNTATNAEARSKFS